MKLWVLIRRDCDEPASWLAHGLLRLKIAPLVVITESMLTDQAQFIHKVGGPDKAYVVMKFANGITLDSRCVHGGVCTVGWAGIRDLARFVEDDREYVSAEHWAFLVSALRCLPGLINPPSPLGLAGPEFDTIGWRCRAVAAGLRVGHAEQGYPLTDGLIPARVVVLDHATFGAEIPTDIAECCVKLRAASGSRLLSIELVRSRSGWEFMSASPRGDLRPGGDALLAALCETIR